MDDPVIGMKLGKRTVISFSHSAPGKGKLYLCKCECGEEKILAVSKLRRGLQTSCFACMRKETKRKYIQSKKAYYIYNNLEFPNESIKKLIKANSE